MDYNPDCPAWGQFDLANGEAKEPNWRLRASSQMRRRLSCTFFSTTPFAFLPTRGAVAEIGIEQVVRTHRGKARVDDAPLALIDLVDRRFMLS
jgi:hypothetical protein